MRKLCGVAVVASVLQLHSQERPAAEWPFWGGDAANSRYTTLTDITPANVQQLERVWEWNTGEQPNAVGHVVRKIGKTPTGERDRPLKDVTIRSITIRRSA